MDKKTTEFLRGRLTLKLKLCPLCGGQAAWWIDDNDDELTGKKIATRAIIQCQNRRCGLTMSRYYPVLECTYTNYHEEIYDEVLDMQCSWNDRLHWGKPVIPGLMSDCVICGQTAYVQKATPRDGVTIRCTTLGCCSLTIPGSDKMTPARLRGLINQATHRWNLRTPTKR